MKIFLDANILISVLNKEYPVFTYSSRILSLTEYDHVNLYTSPVCLAIAFYFAEKKSGRIKAKYKIELLSTHLGITGIDKDSVQKTLQNKAIEDFEDGLEYYSALSAGCEFIITENPDDFYFSEIPVYCAKEFLMTQIEISKFKKQ